MIDNNDTESLFASLDIPFERTVETTAILNNNSIMNHNDDIEDISEDFGHIELNYDKSSSPFMIYIWSKIWALTLSW
jgi:hypothetical protein